MITCVSPPSPPPINQVTLFLLPGHPFANSSRGLQWGCSPSLAESSAGPAPLPRICTLTSHCPSQEKLDAVLSTEYAGNEHLAKQLVSLREHTAVLRLFGRYPHRNALFGREETPEEAEWCKRDDIPGWAKSQIKKA